MINKLPDGDPFGFNTAISKIDQYRLMKEERFTIKDIEVSYTELNYWDKKGLIPVKRENESQWRKFNFFDIVWLGIVRELREFGVKTEIISVYKEELYLPIEKDQYEELLKEQVKSEFKDIDAYSRPLTKQLTEMALTGQTNPNDTITYFEHYLLVSLVGREHISLLLFNEGVVIPWFDDDDKKNSTEARKFRSQNSHVSIPLAEMISQLIDENLILPYLPDLYVMSKQESELLAMTHTGKYESISISFQDEKPDIVTVKTSTDADARTITDAIMEGKYQAIKLKIHNGKTVKIENENKMRYTDLGKDR